MSGEEEKATGPGRPKGSGTKWEELDMDNKLEIVAAWCRDGATDKDIATNLGIGLSTLYRWKKDHVEFKEALKVNKEIADIRIENALYQRALGYEYEEEKIIVEADGKRRLERTKKREAPHTTAAIYWLKNRRPDRWRDRHEIGLDGNLDHTVDLSGLSVEELRRIANQLAEE